MVWFWSRKISRALAVGKEWIGRSDGGGLGDLGGIGRDERGVWMSLGEMWFRMRDEWENLRDER